MRHCKLLNTDLLKAISLAAFISVCTLTGAADGPPVILQQPVNVTAREGESINVSLAVDGSTPLIIVWLRNGVPVTSGTNTSLLISPVRASHDGTVVSAMVLNPLRTVVSSNAFVTIEPGIVLATCINRSAKLQFFRGWPLILELTVIHPDAFEPNCQPILLSAQSGPWVNALQMAVADAQGQVQSWPLRPAMVTNETLQLGTNLGGRMTWWLTPNESSQLPLGEFSVTCTLNTTNVNRPGAWKGLLSSVPATLSISNEATAMGLPLTEQKRRLFAEYALLSGDPLQARREIDVLLTAYPTNIGGLTYDVFLKRDAGLFDDAFQSVQLALDQVAIQSADAPEPPTELLRLEAELSEIVSPPILQPTRAGEQMIISWDGHPALFSYRLEVSSDLISWSVLATNVAAVSNRYSFILTPSRGTQFYRVVR